MYRAAWLRIIKYDMNGSTEVGLSSDHAESLSECEPATNRRMCVEFRGSSL